MKDLSAKAIKASLAAETESMCRTGMVGPNLRSMFEPFIAGVDPKELASLGVLAAVLSKVGRQAEEMHSALCSAPSIEDWRQYVSAHPPSPEVIGMLLVVHDEVVRRALKRDTAVANATKRHAPLNDAKLRIQGEWRRDREQYRSKSDFARIQSKLLQTQLGILVTEKTIRDRWLKLPE